MAGGRGKALSRPQRKGPTGGWVERGRIGAAEDRIRQRLHFAIIIRNGVLQSVRGGKLFGQGRNRKKSRQCKQKKRKG